MGKQLQCRKHYDVIILPSPKFNGLVEVGRVYVITPYIIINVITYTIHVQVSADLCQWREPLKINEMCQSSWLVWAIACLIFVIKSSLFKLLVTYYIYCSAKQFDWFCVRSKHVNKSRGIVCSCLNMSRKPTLIWTLYCMSSNLVQNIQRYAWIWFLTNTLNGLIWSSADISMSL